MALYDKLPNLRETLSHEFLDGEWLFSLLRPMHSSIMMRGRFKLTYGAGKVSGLVRCASRAFSFSRTLMNDSSYENDSSCAFIDDSWLLGQG